MNHMAKKFPCPYCRGQGSWIEHVTDEGYGPLYECDVCEGQGMIEIDGPIHQRIKQWKEARDGQTSSG